MTRQFNDFFKSHFSRFFAIWPNCAALQRAPSVHLLLLLERADLLMHHRHVLVVLLGAVQVGTDSHIRTYTSSRLWKFGCANRVC